VTWSPRASRLPITSVPLAAPDDVGDFGSFRLWIVVRPHPDDLPACLTQTRIRVRVA
jgi:hypothetical protein